MSSPCSLILHIAPNIHEVFLSKVLTSVFQKCPVPLLQHDKHFFYIMMYKQRVSFDENRKQMFTQLG